MASRAEITTKYAKAYVRASKKDKGRILAEVVAVTGWSRDNARPRLSAAAKQPPGSGRAVAKRPRKPRPPKYSYDALKVLQKVWAASGGQCGKHLAASMRLQLDFLHGDFIPGISRVPAYTRDVLFDVANAAIEELTEHGIDLLSVELLLDMLEVAWSKDLP